MTATIPYHLLREEPDASGLTVLDEEKEPEAGNRGPVVVCGACRHRITRNSARMAVHGGERHVFFNPHGLVFEIGCFSAAPGCARIGAPTTDFSWFPGYSWQIAICGNCHAHLGWCYAPQADGTAGTVFWGLILDHLDEEAGDPGPQ